MPAMVLWYLEEEIATIKATLEKLSKGNANKDAQIKHQDEQILYQ